MKYRLVVITIILGLSCFKINAQKQLDSLYNIWLDVTKPDSTRAVAYTAYINDRYLYDQPDSVLVLIRNLERFNKEKEFEFGKLYANKIKCAYYFQMAEYPDAINYCEKGLRLANHYKKPRHIGSFLNNLGNIYAEQGNYLKSLKNYKEALGAYEGFDFKDAVSTVLHNIGSLYADQEIWAEALTYYEESLLLSKETGDDYGVSHATGNMGSVYEELKDYNRALRHYEESLVLNKKLDDQSGVAFSLYSIGSIFAKLNQNTEAQSYFENSLKASEPIGDKREMIAALVMMGTNFNATNQYMLAVKKCKRAFDLAREIGNVREQQRSSFCMYNAQKAIGNLAEALKYHEQTIELKDSLNVTATAKQLQNMEFNKERLADSLLQEEQKLKREIVHQAEVRRKDKNKNIAIATGIFFLLVSGGFYSRWRYVKRSKAIIEKEKDRSENLLLNILPAEVAEELKEKGSADAQDFDMVSILFSDFKDFTGLSEKMTAKELVANINQCFKAFDEIMQKYSVEKIKTIGDAYMAAGGLPINFDTSVKDTVLAALEMQEFITKLYIEKAAIGEHAFEMRVGIHTGPVVAGIVGVKKFQYDIWGDTVNTASRMESHGNVGRVNISQDTYNYIKDEPEFAFKSRGMIEAKGKGKIEMFFVSRNADEL